MKPTVTVPKSIKLGFIDNLLLNIADKIVFKKIRDRFGGRLRFAFSGAAALSKEVADFIDNLEHAGL